MKVQKLEDKYGVYGAGTVSQYYLFYIDTCDLSDIPVNFSKLFVVIPTFISPKPFVRIAEFISRNHSFGYIRVKIVIQKKKRILN